MEETARPDSSESSIAAIVAVIVLPVAVYLAGWQIDWTSETSPDSLLRYVLPVAFCIIVPSVIGSTVAAIVRATRR